MAEYIYEIESHEDNESEIFIGWIRNHSQKLIRCKDCKWYGRVDKRRFYRGMDCLQNRIGTIVTDKDYCSRAERKEE